MIAFASSFPGQIREYQIAPGRELIVQKSGFLAAESGVDLSIFFQKRLGAGFFGEEGIFNTVVTGPGRVWLQTMPISNVANLILQMMPAK